MKPRIVAFAKEWEDVPTCITHVFRRMARTMPVLWISSIGTRKPKVGFSRDAGRIMRRLRSGLRRAEQKENSLRVLSPVVIPGAKSVVGRTINRLIMRFMIARELRDMGSGPAEYWCTVPNAVDLLPRGAGRVESVKCKVEGEERDRRPETADERELQSYKVTEDGRRAEEGYEESPCPLPLAPRRSKVVYYCVDDWGKFQNLDGTWLEKKERQLLGRADAVFTPARCLAEKCRRIIREEGRKPEATDDKVHYMPHGVEYEKFAAALEETTAVPDDVTRLSKPVIGFYGNLYPWIDFELLESIVAKRPEWTFVVIGHPYCDVSRFAKYSNIHLLGRREHDDLPRYCKGFDAAIIPYDLDDPRMESVNPVKARELLAAGVPLVASDIPELRGFGDQIITCRTLEEWLAGLDKQVKRSDRREISASVRKEDWSEKVREMRAVVELI